MPVRNKTHEAVKKELELLNVRNDSVMDANRSISRELAEAQYKNTMLEIKVVSLEKRLEGKPKEITLCIGDSFEESTHKVIKATRMEECDGLRKYFINETMVYSINSKLVLSEEPKN